MRLLWKIVIPLALVLPLGAFVAGSLVASAADDPAPRDTIVIQDSRTRPLTGGASSPSAGPSPTSTGDRPDDRGDDNGVRVITPSPDDLDDDSDDDGRDGDDDNSGHGSDDGDDNSGHGGGGGDDD